MKSLKFIISIVVILGCSSTDKIDYPKNFNKRAPSSNIDILKSFARQEYRPNQKYKDIAIAIAISGGGHRAANFGAGVLAELEKYNLLNEIDYISTVSGGGFAGGAYISTLIEHLKKHKNTNGYSFNKFLKGPYKGRDMLKHLRRSYTWSLIFGFLFPKYWIGSNDRGDLLESKIDDWVLGRSDRGWFSGSSLLLKEIFRYKRGKENCPKMVPYCVANATIFENGALFPFTPDILKEYGVTNYTHRGYDEDLLHGKETQMPLSVGIKASASFPVGVPATTLKCKYKILKDIKDHKLFLQLMDGGLCDNLGKDSAINMLNNDKSTKKILIIVDAFKDQNYPFSRNEKEPNELDTIMRTMGIGLDAVHVDYQAKIKKYCRSKKIKVVFLDFNLIKYKDLKSITKIRSVKKIIGDDIEKKKKAEKIIFEGPKNVATAFVVNEIEQAMLIEVGRITVRKKIIEILKTIK